MIGKTMATGFQAGRRRTFAISREKLWRLVCSSRGQELLGQGPNQLDPYSNGVSTFNEGSHYRQKVETGLESPPLLQVRVVAVDDKKATLALHIEKLKDSVHREAYLLLFDSALKGFTSEIDKINRQTFPST